MRRTGFAWRGLAVGLAVLGLAAGCDGRPTYPKTRFVESLQELFQGEHLATTVRLTDRTLAIHLDYPGALVSRDGEVSLGPGFDEAIRKVLTAIHRVLLSSDAEVRFYVLLISDPQTPGAYLTMVRYFDDIRRANANMLDTPEIFARTILELDAMGAPPPLDQYVPRGIRMEEFLSWQLSRRIQAALADALEAGGAATVGRCSGRFEDGEFAFTLNVASPTDTPLDEPTIQKAFQVSMNVVAKVLASYRFDAFDAVRLIHPVSGRMLLLPKTRLEPFK
jgi:hypothetical protein